MEQHNAEASFAAALEASHYVKHGMLPMWTIYDHPLDFPEHFVVRMHVVDSSGEPKVKRFGVLCFSLEDAREQIPVYCTLLQREAADDPVIVETWL